MFTKSVPKKTFQLPRDFIATFCTVWN